jgi:hypothetical protein
MVRYELLTGLKGHRLSDYELVLSGGSSELPNYLSLGITQLLLKCWHMEPCQRAGWSEIYEILDAELGVPNNNVAGIVWQKLTSKRDYADAQFFVHEVGDRGCMLGH